MPKLIIYEEKGEMPASVGASLLMGYLQMCEGTIDKRDVQWDFRETCFHQSKIFFRRFSDTTV